MKKGYASPTARMFDIRMEERIAACVEERYIDVRFINTPLGQCGEKLTSQGVTIREWSEGQCGVCSMVVNS